MMAQSGMRSALTNAMRILKKVVDVPRRVIAKVADATREHASNAIHRVLDRVDNLVGTPERHLATATAGPIRHIRKQPGHKKPRAERRRARRAAHTAT